MKSPPPFFDFLIDTTYSIKFAISTKTNCSNRAKKVTEEYYGRRTRDGTDVMQCQSIFELEKCICIAVQNDDTTFSIQISPQVNSVCFYEFQYYLVEMLMLLHDKSSLC